MITVNTTDNKPVKISTTGNVGGPSQRGSRGGGQTFGTYFTYISWDDRRTWWRVPHRSEHQAGSWVEAHSLDEIKLEVETSY